MATRVNADDAIADAASILKVWTANPEFKMKDVTLEGFQGDNTRLETVLGLIEAQEAALVPLRNERDDLAIKLNAHCTRARSGIKGYFGENSTEYEQAGGTRTAERKRTGRRSKSNEPEK